MNHAHFESMVLIASKHEVDPRRLVDAFFEALETGVSHCGGLRISCRAANQEAAVFLVTKGESVVWQFPVKLEGLRSGDVQDYIDSLPMLENVKKRVYDKNQTVGGLRFGMKGVSVTGTIVEIAPMRRVFTRWGTEAHVSTVKLEDATGSIRLSLWNNQIDLVQIGDVVEIKNCAVSRFAGELQLRLGRKGRLSVISALPNDALVHYPTVK